MPTIISYKDSSGSEIGELSLSESVFGLEPNIHVMYEAVKMYRANRRQGTVFVKNRSHVSGTTKKPFRQKGTGRARQGSHKVGHYRGGGAPFGPKPRDYSYSIPKKVKRLALRSALSAKQRDGLVKSLKFSSRILPSVSSSSAVIPHFRTRPPGSINPKY